MRYVVPMAYFLLFLGGLIACAGQPTPTLSLAPGLEPSPTEISPAHTVSPLPLITPSPTLTPTLTPSPAPQLLQLTHNSCCVQPFFSPDSTRLLFLDKPAPDAPTGFWSVPLSGGEPELYTGKLGIYSPDMQLVAYPEGGQTHVERISDAQRWTIPNGGRSLSFSPSGAQVAWTTGSAGPPFDTALREVWSSAFDGTNARQIVTLIGGGFSGWISETHALVTGRQTLEETESALWVLSLEDGSMRELIRGGRIRSVAIASSGAWVAYLVTFGEDPTQNGIWIQNIATGARVQLDLFGGYRWRDADHLLVIPLDPNAAAGPVVHQLWEVDAATGKARALTDPALIPFKMAGGDWTVSPDGHHVAFVSATDRNIWVLTIQP